MDKMMKIAIIQAVDASTGSDFEKRHFWQPCENSVKNWAERRGFDHHFYAAPIQPKVQKSLNVEWNKSPKILEIFFNKLSWMKDQADKYDVLCWIDGDMYCWGEPRNLFNGHFCDLSKFNFPVLHHMIRGDPRSWERVNSSLFWAPSDLIVELADWMTSMVYNPELRGDLYITFLSLCKQMRTDFTDEHALTAWYYENKDRCVPHMVNPDHDEYNGCNWWYQPNNNPMYKKDSFIHLTKKYLDKMKFDAFRAYLAWEEKQDRWMK